jgi:hypothetical protein
MSTDPHLDTGARALHALPPDEAARFDEHLASCELCAAEYASLLETTALLGTAVAESAPATLEERLIRLIGVTPQLPPAHSEDTGPATLVDAGSAAPVAPGVSGHVPAAPWYRRRWAWAAAAAVAAAAIVIAVIIAVRGTPTSPTEEAARACVEQASDAIITHPTVGAGGQVTTSASCHAAVVDLPTLPGLPTDRGYQLWVIAGTQARSAGMVQEQIAAGGVSVVTPLSEGDTNVGITVEPASGSKAPTTQPIWLTPLPH